MFSSLETKFSMENPDKEFENLNEPQEREFSLLLKRFSLENKIKKKEIFFTNKR